MVKERKLAELHSYEDPVCETFTATSLSYHSCLDHLLQRAARHSATAKFIIASHNEDTVKYAMKR